MQELDQQLNGKKGGRESGKREEEIGEFVDSSTSPGLIDFRLMEHLDDADINDPVSAMTTGGGNTDGEKDGMDVEGEGEGQTNSNTNSGNEETPVFRSFQCEDCGKLLADTDRVELHAESTGHQNFKQSTEEVKPLTEEEKARQAELLQERLKKKREEREEAEKKLRLEQEIKRRKAGQEAVKTREEVEKAQRLRLIEEKKRQKMEDKKRLENIRRQMEMDKKNRKAMFNGKKTTTTTSTTTTTTMSEDNPVVEAEYDEAEIMIRMPDGSRIEKMFDGSQTIGDVYKWAGGEYSGQFVLMETFPRKEYKDWDVTLKDAGFTPSAALVLSKR
eukprot:TRINITY_DN2290_c0_g1_i1.p1 TRINITY_DN2290_c0_g1~~TRINITY_DN2290_c0_g1_i1.p1  ORF type:complete len:331 (+),score=130.22 TRINITY_DN2290_c0_g1_i1:176-1168(+)